MNEMSIFASHLNFFASDAVPFEEDAQNPEIWFVDHSYMENMFAMFRKVNGMSIHFPSFSAVLSVWGCCEC